MASDESAGKIPVASPVHGSQASNSINFKAGGKSLPISGKTEGSRSVAAAANTAVQSAKAPPAVPASSTTKPAGVQQVAPQDAVIALNRHLNDSGRPTQFRLAPGNSNTLQEINPANGEVIGEFSVAEFPALARGIGATGILIDETA